MWIHSTPFGGELLLVDLREPFKSDSRDNPWRFGKKNFSAEFSVIWNIHRHWSNNNNYLLLSRYVYGDLFTFNGIIPLSETVPLVKEHKINIL